METPQADHIDKIEKLLNLAAKAGTEHEAKAAFAAASKLMTKYGIQQHQLTGKDGMTSKQKEAAEVTQVNFTTPKYASERPYHLYVRQIIKHCFFVSIVKVPDRYGNSPDYFMLGTREDCAFAGYAFDVLSQIFLKHLSTFLKQNGLPRTPKYFNGYWAGLAEGFNQAWDEARRAEIAAQGAESYAIVLVDKAAALTKFVAARSDIKHKKQNRSQDFNAREAGVRDGRNIKIHRPLGAGASTSGGLLQ